MESALDVLKDFAGHIISIGVIAVRLVVMGLKSEEGEFKEEDIDEGERQHD